MTEATNEPIENKRSLSTEGDDDSKRIQYNRLPIGIWFVERVGVLTRSDPVVREKYVISLLLLLLDKREYSPG